MVWGIDFGFLEIDFSNSTVATILSNGWIKQVFVMFQNNWWDVVHTAITYFYSIVLYIYIYIYFVVYIYIYIYIYKERYTI